MLASDAAGQSKYTASWYIAPHAGELAAGMHGDQLDAWCPCPRWLMRLGDPCMIDRDVSHPRDNLRRAAGQALLAARGRTLRLSPAARLVATPLRIALAATLDARRPTAS